MAAVELIVITSVSLADLIRSLLFIQHLQSAFFYSHEIATIWEIAALQHLHYSITTLISLGKANLRYGSINNVGYSAQDNPSTLESKRSHASLPTSPLALTDFDRYTSHISLSPPISCWAISCPHGCLTTPTSIGPVFPNTIGTVAKPSYTLARPVCNVLPPRRRKNSTVFQTAMTNHRIMLTRSTHTALLIRCWSCCSGVGRSGM